jgi:hypothetical protein
MKKWFISFAMLVVLSCNKTTLVDPVKSNCDDISVFEFYHSQDIPNDKGIIYTYSLDKKIIRIEERNSPSYYNYNFKYDKSSLILSRTSFSSNKIDSQVFQMNENNSIKSYQYKNDDVEINGLYEYDIYNHLVKCSVTKSSISTPDKTQTTIYIIEWQNDNISTISEYFKFRNEAERIEKKVVIESQAIETVNTDNFYNLIFFVYSGFSFEEPIYLDYIGINKGKMPKNLIASFQIFGRDGSAISRKAEFSYKIDEFKRITGVKLSNYFSPPVDFTFKYLCH